MTSSRVRSFVYVLLSYRRNARLSSSRLANFAAVAGAFTLALAFGYLGLARAHDQSHPHYDWYKSQKMTPETQQRLSVPWKSCCDEADHFQTRFRLVNDGSKYGTETYEYWTGSAWKAVPHDIIQRKPTPDGRPVLFILKNTGREVCFIIDKEGI